MQLGLGEIIINLLSLFAAFALVANFAYLIARVQVMQPSNDHGRN